MSLMSTEKTNTIRRVAGADGIPVREEFRNMKGHFASSSWLAITNAYLQDCMSGVKQKRLVDSQGLRQYLAASIILHCSDGWAYLGRAINSALIGDVDCTKHLAYYAELRAGVSILAFFGIGVFNDHHVVVDSGGKCTNFSDCGRTHVFAWNALEAKINLIAEYLLKEVLFVRGKCLNDWFMASGSTSSAATRATQAWLVSWGIDIKLFNKDRNSRNKVSYRPTRLSQKNHFPLTDMSKYLVSFWNIFEPGSRSFTNIDFALLNEGLKTIGVTSVLQIEQMLSSLGIHGADQVALRDSMFNFTRTPIVKFASKNDNTDHAEHHIQVISRAALFLRLATGLAFECLSNAGINKTELNFWWSRLGFEHGIWCAGQEPADLTDLWADIQEEVAALQEFTATPQDYCGLHSQKVFDWAMLQQCERICLWGLQVN